MNKRPPPFSGFGIMPKAAYGEAIRYCFEGEDGKLWITNEEYASQVNFCPYCGFEVKVRSEARPLTYLALLPTSRETT